MTTTNMLLAAAILAQPVMIFALLLGMAASEDERY